MEREELDMYNLTLDCNGAPVFSQKNIDIIKCAIRYNSNYRAATDMNYPEYRGSYVELLRKSQTISSLSDEGYLKSVVESIDKINSTHLAVDRGVDRTVDCILSDITISGLEKRILMRDDTLVTAIANASISRGGKRFNLSFASKFCAYVSRYIYGLDLFCIYDKVVQSVLPYYHYTYSRTNERYYETNRNNKRISIVAKIAHKETYCKYRRIIDETISGIEERNNISISYEDFDQLLWYYFKGSEQLRERLLCTLP